MGQVVIVGAEYSLKVSEVRQDVSRHDNVRLIIEDRTLWILCNKNGFSLYALKRNI
jgi:hypothetical protein